MRTGTVKFFNESKVTDSLQTKKQENFVHASGINAEELREGDRVSYEEEEGRKGKVAESSSYLSKKFIFSYECLRRSDLFGTFFLH
jgi:CspA family cold shock protein